MSMTACSICGGTIDCSKDFFYVCRKCKAAIHFKCDKRSVSEIEMSEYTCPKCREESEEAKDSSAEPETDWKKAFEMLKERSLLLLFDVNRNLVHQEIVIREILKQCTKDSE